MVHMPAKRIPIIKNNGSNCQADQKKREEVCHQVHEGSEIGVELTDKWMPFDWQSLRSLSCCQTGWHSTWLAAGGTRATASKSSSFLQEKLLTPMARALPESYSFSIAFHVAGMSGLRMFSVLSLVPFFARTGPWTCEAISQKLWRREECQNLKNLECTLRKNCGETSVACLVLNFFSS